MFAATCADNDSVASAYKSEASISRYVTLLSKRSGKLKSRWIAHNNLCRRTQLCWVAEGRLSLKTLVVDPRPPSARVVACQPSVASLLEPFEQPHPYDCGHNHRGRHSENHNVSSSGCGVGCYHLVGYGALSSSAGNVSAHGRGGSPARGEDSEQIPAFYTVIFAEAGNRVRVGRGVGFLSRVTCKWQYGKSSRIAQEWERRF